MTWKQIIERQIHLKRQAVRLLQAEIKKFEAQITALNEQLENAKVQDEVSA